jgi:hypothetical protein
MKTQENQDWERKLEELEININQSNPSTSTNMPELNESKYKSQKIAKFLITARNLFNNLPIYGKLGVIVVAGMLGFSLLKTALQIIISVLVITILGVVLYVLYKSSVTPRGK